MIVTLGTANNLGAGASQTFPYACQSVSKIFLQVTDDATAYDAFVTVQLGSRTIINGASAFGLFGMSSLQGGGAPSNSVWRLQIDLGHHQLLDNENLYVTIRAGSAQINVTDVSALVDEPSQEFPVRYTEYSDNTFTAENVLEALSFSSSQATVALDSNNIEVRSSVNSSSPSLISCSDWYSATTIEASYLNYFGRIVSNKLPLTTTFNYSTSGNTDRIIVASQMGTTARAIKSANRQTALAKSQVGK